MFLGPVAPQQLALIAFCALVLVAGSSAAAAQDAPDDSVDVAYARYLEADFGAARQALELALADESIEPSALARAHALFAVLASLDSAVDPRVMTAAIESAVAIDPGVATPDGASRVVRESFEAERTRRAAAPARVSLTTTLDGAARTVEARPEHVPSSLDARVTLTCARGAASTDDEDDDVARVVVGVDAAACEGALRTAGGARVLASMLAIEALPTASGGDDVVVGVVVGVVVAVVIGAAIAIGVAFGSRSDGGLGAPTVVEW